MNSQRGAEAGVRHWRVALAVLAALVVIQMISAGLNQDVRYLLGALSAGGAGGWSATEVWAHRPLAMRQLMAVLEWVSPGGYRLQEAVLRGLCSLGAAAAAYLFGRALRHYGPQLQRTGPLIGFAVGAALVLAPGWDFAEPEWFAIVLAVAGIGVALSACDMTTWPCRFGIAAAGMLLAYAGLLKYTTITTVVIALAVLWCIQRRLALRTAIATAIATGVGFGLTVAIEPHEWQWLGDMSRLNPPASTGLVKDAIEGVVNSLVVSPVTVAAVVAALLLVRRHRAAAGWLVAGWAVAYAPYLVQHQNFLYHQAAVPVLSAAFVAWAMTVAPSPLRRGIVSAALAAAVVAALLFLPDSRNRSVPLAAVALLLVAGLGVAVALLGARRAGAGKTGRIRPWAVLVAVVAPLLVTLSPATAYSYSLAHANVTSTGNVAAGNPLQIPGLPAEARVLYFGFNTPYRLGNPSACRYVSPTFLQRASGDRAAQIVQTDSFAENLACVDDPNADYAVVDFGWFRLDAVDQRVRSAFERNFDCGQTLGGTGVVACRRR